MELVKPSIGLIVFVLLGVVILGGALVNFLKKK